MNVESNGHNGTASEGRTLEADMSLAIGPSFHLWLSLQSGQEQITRFSGYIEKFGERMRHQNGHEHRCSVCSLFTYYMIRIRPHCILDELLLTRCINHHDEPEGILKIDVLAPKKTDLDDLREYEVFEKMYRPLGDDVWMELQKAFLLQFCLTNPKCFPPDARDVMSNLAKHCRHEALFFDGVQRLDYLYYAYECYRRGLHSILQEVAYGQLKKIELVAAELPGFSEAVWTREVAGFFYYFANQMVFEEVIQ
jgi:hypothetical protein